MCVKINILFCQCRVLRLISGGSWIFGLVGWNIVLWNLVFRFFVLGVLSGWGCVVRSRVSGSLVSWGRVRRSGVSGSLVTWGRVRRSRVSGFFVGWGLVGSSCVGRGGVFFLVFLLRNVFGVLGVTLVFDVGVVSVAVSLVVDDLSAAVGEKNVLWAGGHLTVAVLFLTIVVVSVIILDIIRKVVRASRLVK